MATSFSRGHKIFHVCGEGWKYCDTGELIDEMRACASCGERPTAEGHDYCLGELPGVEAACCGHGVSTPALMTKVLDCENRKRDGQ